MPNENILSDFARRDGKAKIMAVDDTPENLQLLIETLRDVYTVVPAKNGTRALALANGESKPDLILLDVMMPGMDGFDVCLSSRPTPPPRPSR